MLAACFDSLQILQWMYLLAHRDPDGPPAPPAPAPLPRPGETVEAEPSAADRYDTSHIPAIEPAELAAWLA